MWATTSICQFVRKVKYLGDMIGSSMKTNIDFPRPVNFILTYCSGIVGVALIK